MKNLGFGMMRLPVLSGPTDFDYEQLNKMVDAFLEAGYTYFDTSFVYHNGRSEEATCIESGVDLIMPGGKGVVKALAKAVKEGRLSPEALRTSCGRVLDATLGA